MAWNIGTTGRMTSRSLTASALAVMHASVWSTVERWLYTTPLGLPVVSDRSIAVALDVTSRTQIASAVAAAHDAFGASTSW